MTHSHSGERIDAPRLLQDESPVCYVCMPGSPYAGSTLLGYLLDAHPECASMGAAPGLPSRIDLATYLCSCGELFMDCEFWKRVAARTSELGYPTTVFKKDFWNTHVRLSDRRWLNGILIRSLGNGALNAARDAVVTRWGPARRSLLEARASTWALARAVLEITGKTVFVDTARDHQRPKYLATAPMFDVRVIHLVRDPRGGVASIMKHTGVDVARAARQWRHYNLEAHRVQRHLPRDSWMLLGYEALCADPQGTLDRISCFIGVDPAAVPSNFKSGKHHIIGNSMRLKGIGEIREDKSWLSVLDEDDVQVISRITGSTSHLLGYEWP